MHPVYYDAEFRSSYFQCPKCYILVLFMHTNILSDPVKLVSGYVLDLKLITIPHNLSCATVEAVFDTPDLVHVSTPMVTTT
jgi:hypothetical protein